MSDWLVVLEQLRERFRAETMGQHALSLVVRCEACGLGYQLLGTGVAFEVAGSCTDCGGPLYVLDGFAVDGSHVADAYGEGFAAGWDACLALWEGSVETRAAAETVDPREGS